MEKRANSSQITWIYWGTLISSLGTFTFPGATVGILTQLHYPIWQIGALMGLTRAGTLVGNFIFGDLPDRFDARKVVLATEIIAFILSGLLMLTWSLGEKLFALFAIAVFLRFIAISISGPSRNKLIKVLSDKYNKDHFHSAVTLNAVTFGPGVLGSILGFLAIKYYSYYWVLGFDAITFIINGAITVFFIKSTSTIKSQHIPGLIEKFRIYFSHKKLILFDILLTLPFMGTNVLMARLSQGIGYRVPVLLATFGLGAIAAPNLLKMKRNNLTHSLGYGSLVFAFFGLLFFRDSFPEIIALVFIRNIAYWYLFNLYTGHFQERETTNKLGSLFAARAFLGTAIIGLGEVLSGTFGELISLNTDLTIRGILSMIILLITMKVTDV